MGIQVSHVLAPDSGLAEFINFLTFPAGFMIGVIFWEGTAIPAAIRRFIHLYSSGNRSSERVRINTVKSITPGTFAFVPALLITSVFAGFIMAAISDIAGFFWVLCIYCFIGLVYGVICWRLAQAGYLPFPH